MHIISKKMKAVKGFTLIELLVVIAIIGLLASIISVSLVSSKAKGRDAKRISDIRTLQLALEEYYNDNGNYPVSLSASLVPTYISVLPVDPKDNATSYQYSAYNSARITNCASGANLPIGYHLGAALEDASNPALQTDAQAPALPTTGGLTNCNTTAGFNGKGTLVTTGTAPVCGATANVANGVTSQCYDVTN